MVQHDVEITALPGGAKMLEINMPNAVTAYFAIYIRGGFRYAAAEKYEIPHLLEHLAFEGNKVHQDPLDFKMALENLGASYNASTGLDYVSYYYTILPDQLGEICDLALAQVFAPLHDQKRVRQQAGVIEQELKQYADNDSSLCYWQAGKTFYPKNTPFYRQRAEDLQKITVADLHDFYKQTYVTENVRVVVAGVLSPEIRSLLRRKIGAALRNVPAGKAYEFDRLSFGKDIPQIVVGKGNTPNRTRFFMEWIDPIYDDPASHAILLGMTVYGRGLASRMQLKARERGLTYTFGCGSSCSIDEVGAYILDSVTPDKALELFELALQELREVRTGKFSEAELQRAKQLVVGRVKRNLEIPSDFVGGYNTRFLYDEPLEEPGEVVERYENLTKKEVKAAMEKYLRSDNWVLSLVGHEVGKQSDWQRLIDLYL